jgi:AraC-like DNA-binding protein
LLQRDLRVSEIAFAVGFQSLSQFNRVFKKQSGKSPTAYRAEARTREKQRRSK